MDYEPKLYREKHLTQGLVPFEVVYKETDLWIAARSNLKKEASRKVKEIRGEIESFILAFPFFASSFSPVEVTNEAPQIVKRMAKAAEIAGVGPMASVAGAIAEAVGEELLSYSSEVIVENGGDLFLKTNRERLIAVFAGKSPLSYQIGILIKPEDTPVGVCTSSGTVGHSFSFGQADAVVVISKDTALADAAATAIGNVVSGPDRVEKGLERARKIPGLEGVFIVAGDKIAAWGKVELKALEKV